MATRRGWYRSTIRPRLAAWRIGSYRSWLLALFVFHGILDALTTIWAASIEPSHEANTVTATLFAFDGAELDIQRTLIQYGAVKLLLTAVIACLLWRYRSRIRPDPNWKLWLPVPVLFGVVVVATNLYYIFWMTWVPLQRAAPAPWNLIYRLVETVA